ncbi:hypothetical protein CWE02_17860 [Brucella pituitosa]|nr:hypothetical protein CWE02_17860 [Brucella pituitosa]
MENPGVSLRTCQTKNARWQLPVALNCLDLQLSFMRAQHFKCMQHRYEKAFRPAISAPGNADNRK